MEKEKSDIVLDIASMLLEKNKIAAQSIICQEYPHTYYFPEEFPYQSHWKMTETHSAYWELVPTIDHIYPIAKGGIDDEKNWVTTSMKNNSIKSNYTIDEIHWKLYPKGDISKWDGLTGVFLELVNKDNELLRDSYIKSWYKVSRAVTKK